MLLNEPEPITLAGSLGEHNKIQMNFYTKTIQIPIIWSINNYLLHKLSSTIHQKIIM